jgi:hypothetical protein
MPGLAVRAVRLTSTASIPAVGGTFNPYDSMRRNMTSVDENDSSQRKLHEGRAHPPKSGAPPNGAFLTADREPDCMVLIPGMRRG